MSFYILFAPEGFFNAVHGWICGYTGGNRRIRAVMAAHIRKKKAERTPEIEPYRTTPYERAAKKQ